MELQWLGGVALSALGISSPVAPRSRRSRRQLLDGWQIYNKYSRVLWQAVLCPIIVLQLPPKDLLWFPPKRQESCFVWDSLKGRNQRAIEWNMGLWDGGLAHFVPSQQHQDNKCTIRNTMGETQGQLNRNFQIELARLCLLSRGCFCGI